MKNFLPRSLTGQLALVMAGALLIASLVNLTLLIGERQRSAQIEQTGPALARFVDEAQVIFASPPPIGSRLVNGGPGRGGGPGPGRYQVLPGNPIDNRGIARDGGLERTLHSALVDAGITVADDQVRASSRSVMRPDRGFGFGGPGGPGGGPLGGPNGFRPRSFGGPDPQLPGGGPPSQPAGVGLMPPPPPDDVLQRGPPRAAREIVLAAQLPDGRWLSGTNFSPEPPGDDMLFLGISTFITFAFVLAAALWIATRLSRPLRDLTAAAQRVGAASEPEEVVVRGPGDVRQTLEAFNAMSQRVSQLLGEKDVMLGALGHDLRTPLSSLRIRIESMEPESERLKAVKTIEEASDLLEDILELARQGRSKEPVQTMDVSILVEDMVEDYAETGAPVTLTGSAKAPVSCRPVLFRRALRNLIDNAVSYGERARVSVVKASGEILVNIEDDGPGMSDEALKSAADPFYRGEASRNRTTGGAGLGLTLASAIVKAHGGALDLKNRDPKGFLATIRLPQITPPSPVASS